MDIPAYLNRISYTGLLTPTLETLRGLHRAHMLTVPFENLSIHSRETIRLDMDWLFDKIVIRRRGGFCYECNGLFAGLLRELGFNVTLLSARVRKRSEDGFGPEYDHLILRVDLDEPWVADVGFGDSFLEPIRLNFNEEQTDTAGKYRIVEGENGLILEEWFEGIWASQHFFTLKPRSLQEFEGMCYYHQTSPQSPFTEKWLATIAHPNGRTTLTAIKQTETINGNKKEFVYSSDETYFRLRDLFGIEGITLQEDNPPK